MHTLRCVSFETSHIITTYSDKRFMSIHAYGGCMCEWVLGHYRGMVGQRVGWTPPELPLVEVITPKKEGGVGKGMLD